MPSWPSFRTALILAGLLRLILIAYSEYYDALPTTRVKYTDIDYRVFTDAARFVWHPTESSTAQGPVGKVLGIGDPYARATYRYTPLLAVILTPNIFFLKSFGKILFAFCDLVIGVLLYRLAKASSNAQLVARANIYVSALHLFNPLIFSISTRGSSESILGALVILTLYYASRGKWDAAAILLGASVHWKIYPFIYGASFLTVLGEGRHDWAIKQRIRFTAISFGTFVALGGAMYLIWGYPFLEHTYIYHLSRKDYRHNFSPYFYPIYLGWDKPAFKWSVTANPFMSFLPQMALCLVSGVKFSKHRSDLPFAWFIQTACFVTFNKVCTSQYFLWYIWFLPLILPKLQLSLRTGILCLASWFGGQAVWLSLAYRLEFLGENRFFEVWCASIAFFIINCCIIGIMIISYRG
ncbi:glycosyltransferase family 50 protein [Sistotremastrum niveocremeum HHB9708]|uniref:GPI mannosyltransferase 1 n=1 Tax=Sistotremastrum niveocremeum HHB9708 TaxID=1314777 RepID=A0A164P7J5_9AGAM|nr:glycosyltransferase family 50 protein [Sistotremastrum niveocremeum HHB9708]